MIWKLKEKIASIVNSLLPTGGVNEQTIKSGIWMGAMNFGGRGLKLLMMVVLARLLTPRDFGLLGIAMLTLGSLQLFSELGLEAAIIQRKEKNIDDYLNTAWCLEIGRGLLLASICFFGAPYVASFFSEPRVTPLIRVIGLSPLLYGLRNPAIIYFKKDLDFHKQFVYQLSGDVMNVIFAIGYAIIFQSVWALVLGYVVGSATRFAVSYFIDDYRPHLTFDWPKVRELIGYGKWITGSSILFFLYNRGDDAVVGWAVDATALGFYQVAYEMSNAPATEITQVISSVMFPAYSQLQDDISALREAFFRTVRVTTFATFPLGVGIIAVTPPFVRTFLGTDWMPMTLTMQLLAIYGIQRALGATYGPVYKALGRPDIITKISFLRVALVAIFIYPATVTYGIEGAALVTIGTALVVNLPLNLYIVIRTIETTYSRLMKEVSYPLFASIVMGGSVVLVRWSTSIQSSAVEFFLLVGIGIVSYALSVIILDRTFNWGMERTLRSALGALKG